LTVAKEAKSKKSEQHGMGQKVGTCHPISSRKSSESGDYGNRQKL